MSEEPIKEEKIEPDFSKLEKDESVEGVDKYIVTEDVDPTPIVFAIANAETFEMLPERYETRKKAEAEIKKLDGSYTVVETR